MELIVESDDGRVLGSCDLDCTRWQLVGDHFENIRPITVTITTAGTYGCVYIRCSNGRINNDTYERHGYLQVGYRVSVRAHGLKIISFFGSE